MIGWKITKYLMNRYKEQALSEASKMATREMADGLVIFHTDENGKRWSRWEERGQIPVVRIGKMKEYLGWISAGISGDQMRAQAKLALEAIQESAKHRKDEKAAETMAIAQASIMELMNNSKRIAPAQLFIDYLAVQYVIDGENPRQWDPDSHAYKVKSILEDEANGAGFFLRQKEWSILTELLQITQTAYSELVTQSKTSQEQAEAALKYLSSELSKSKY